MIQEKYKDVVITYSEYDNTWFDGESGKNYESLAKAKEAIDRRRAKNLKFSPIDVFVEGYGGGIRKDTITSIVSSDCVWIKYKDGDKSREKYSFKYSTSPHPYAATKENEFLIAQIGALRKNIDTLEKAIQKKLSALTQIDISLLVKDREGQIQ
jgi:MinD-like ATPase involved in chromosome partitioning or flagellar assembly